MVLSISISGSVSFVVVVVAGSWDVLVLCVGVSGVEERTSGFWDCCLLKVEMRSFLVEEKS